MTITFQNPEAFFLLFGIPIVILFMILFKKKSTILYSMVPTLLEACPRRSHFVTFVPLLLRVVVLCCIIVALARPQLQEAEHDYHTDGVDIIIALDISGSMKAEDFQPENRLEVAKQEAQKFIKSRTHDRVGLVVFSQYSVTQCPLTIDHDVLIGLLDTIHIGMIKDGTAIGLALANAVSRLKNSEAKSKVVILLTDGENNAGQIDPLTAAELAKTFGIKVYTIGVGKGGMVPYPIDDPVFGRRYTKVEVKIDEPTLMKIATITNGMYFRARDRKSLAEVYERINDLEKTEFKETRYVTHKEVFHWIVIPAIIVLFLHVIIEQTIFRTVP